MDLLLKKELWNVEDIKTYLGGVDNQWIKMMIDKWGLKDIGSDRKYFFRKTEVLRFFQEETIES